MARDPGVIMSGGENDPVAPPDTTQPSAGAFANRSQPTGPTPEMQQFLDALKKLNPRFLDVANTLRDQSQGIDPLFGQLRDSAFQRNANIIGEQFGRRGTGGSTAELNALLRANNQATQQFDLLGLQRRDNALTGQLDPLTAMLENLTIPERLRISELTARNAGTVPQTKDSNFLDLLGL